MWVFQQNVPLLKSLCNQKQHILSAISKMMARKGFDPQYLSTWKKAGMAVGLHCLSRAQLRVLLNPSSFWSLKNQPVGKRWGEAGSASVRVCACGTGAQCPLWCQPPGGERHGQPLVFLSTESQARSRAVCSLMAPLPPGWWDLLFQILCSPSPPRVVCGHEFKGA